jgi:hypothetical protein
MNELSWIIVTVLPAARPVAGRNAAPAAPAAAIARKSRRDWLPMLFLPYVAEQPAGPPPASIVWDLARRRKPVLAAAVRQLGDTLHSLELSSEGRSRSV